MPSILDFERMYAPFSVQNRGLLDALSSVRNIDICSVLDRAKPMLESLET